MKNEQDVKKEILSIENRIEELKVKQIMANKLDFKLESGILNDQRALLYEHRDSLEYCLDIIKDLKPEFSVDINHESLQLDRESLKKETIEFLQVLVDANMCSVAADDLIKEYIKGLNTKAIR